MACFTSSVQRILQLFVVALFLSPALSLESSSQRHERRQDTSSSTHTYDVVIYGNTVAAIAAAIQTIRMNKTAVIVSPQTRLGGLTSSGLGWTDSKDGNVIGGIAREFYEKVYEHYQGTSAWIAQSRSSYVASDVQAQPGVAVETNQKVQWTFEPSAAQKILDDWVSDENVPVFLNKSIILGKNGVKKDGTQILSLLTEDGSEFKGSMFIDGSYEGDLMDAAGISYSSGREARSEYDESEAGIIVDSYDKRGHIQVDPYLMPGDSSSGYIKGVQRSLPNPDEVDGDADDLRIQAYNYRLCLTRKDDNRVPFTKPADYDEDAYEILFRYIESGYEGPFFTTQLVPNFKTDSNAAGEVSTDLLGGNYNNETNYPAWDYAERKKAQEAHKSWTQGLLYTLANHERVPHRIRKRISEWGYAKDEFVDNDYFPYEIYIREGRRMKGMYTMRQSDITDPPKTFTNDSIVGVAAYTFDVHRVERVVVDHDLYNEGLVHVPNQAPFPIPYNSIVPMEEEATNFLAPVTMSATHIAYAAIRMEPTYMILGQSAGTAAVMALEAGTGVQGVHRERLSTSLNGYRQVLSEAGGLRPWSGAWVLYLLVGVWYLM